MGLCRTLLVTVWLLCILSSIAEATTEPNLEVSMSEPSGYCWTDLCHTEPERLLRQTKEKRCKDCPTFEKRPVRRENVNLAITCSLKPFYVKASFDLSHLKTYGLENSEVAVGYREKNSEEVTEYLELDKTTFNLKEVQTNNKYVFCINITHSHISRFDHSSICHDLDITTTATSCNTCPYTIDTVLMPRLVLLGKTGVGKSTLGNRLLGNKEGICNSWGGFPKKFGVGHEAVSMTSSVDWMVGHWLGDEQNPLVTIIDTPGTGDVQGRNCDHALHLARDLKKLGKINTFLLTYKGTDNRFDTGLQDQIKLFVTIFGDEFWQFVGSEFSFWSHNIASVEKRMDEMDTDEQYKHEDWNEQYANLFNVEDDIPSFYIDPVFDEDNCEQAEVEKYKEYTDKLWEFMNNGSAYECDQRCRSPSGYFSGEPWLWEDTANNAQRLGDKLTIVWQIWIHGCNSQTSQNYRIVHTSFNTLKQTKIYEYKVSKSNKVRIRDKKLPPQTAVELVDMQKYIIIRLTIDSFQEGHLGGYQLKTDRGSSKFATIKKTVDGNFGPWGEWSECSKKCVSGNEKLGEKFRQRTCTEPQNQGIPCQGSSSDQMNCAHGVGESDVIISCPIDAKWGEWTEFGRCDHPCMRGGNTPMQSRTRYCYPDKFGGKTCEDLSSEARKDRLPEKKETRECQSLPNCPENAQVGDWIDWSQCPECYTEGLFVPIQSRSRPCTEAIKSNDPEQDKNILDCNIFQLKEEQTCKIQPCPVDATWTDYTRWGKCSSNCMDISKAPPKKSRTRMCIPPRYGGIDCNSLIGSLVDEQTCDTLPACPADAILGNWTPWSENCDGCFDEMSSSPRPQQDRKRTCKETQLELNLNMNVKTCADLGDVVETRPCQIRSCPIPASWTQWPRSWEKCGFNCKVPGIPPQQSRTRFCSEAKFGGETCQQLEEKERSAGKDTYAQKRNCPDLLDCPTPARVGTWADWNPACGECYTGGTAIPHQTRKRPCTAANLSGYQTLDAGILTCEMMTTKETERCNIPMCKVNCVWENWTDWSECTKTCGGGVKSTQRWMQTAASLGGAPCMGPRSKTARCNTKRCPAPIRSMELRGGSSWSEGNLFVNSKPVCDDHWDNNDARVVCRMLGFSNGDPTMHTMNSRFGSVPTNFGMDDVKCLGTETDIRLCSHKTSHNCGGGEGAGVICYYS